MGTLSTLFTLIHHRFISTGTHY